ncbi:hypothetical protein AX17_001416 [Amanita inopinata Kibby_2008]|nr:hypothetical protein AX17_001416 [Amanita inopinata Kibby_2008]
MSKPCRFYTQPGGCNKGNKCTFAHSSDRKIHARSSSSGSSSNSPALKQPIPSGVCKFYWSTGNCKHEFKCRFNHTKSPSSTAVSESPLPLVGLNVVPFLAESGLAKVAGTGTDAFFPTPADSLSPTEVHNKIKRFFYDQFRFIRTFDVYAFVNPLNSTVSSNARWTPEDGQLLLTSLATGNGLLRISDVFSWDPVSSHAGSSPQVLSFQRAHLPLLRFFSSDIVVKSALKQLVNALYMTIMNNFTTFTNTLITCMDDMILRESFTDPSSPLTRGLLGSQIIASITVVLFECLTRFKNAISVYPEMTPTVRKLQVWLDAWIEGIMATPPKFNDSSLNNISTRDHILSHLRGRVRSVTAIIDREQARLDRQRKDTKASPMATHIPSHEGLLAMIDSTYDGPGDLSKSGSRHDNDFSDIYDIRTAPTHGELVCTREPYLPVNIFGAPHHLPSESMQKLLDIQFRLLREEFTAPLRSSVQFVRNDLLSNSPRTQLASLLEKRGGKYRGIKGAEDSLLFNVYTGVKAHSITPDPRGLSVNISFDAPPGRARQSGSQARVTFWESVSRKRMMQGGLVALVWSSKTRRNVDVYLGTIASSVKELTDSARQNSARVSARINFFDSEVEMRILEASRYPERRDEEKLLVEAPVMFEAIRPFLGALTREPEMIPFQEHLVHRPPGFFGTHEVKPPRYAALPGFEYHLDCLFEPGTMEESPELTVSVNDIHSVENARRELKQGSRLDSSQVDAVIDALTKEVTLIQGPPGTGKSFTGVELLRVLTQHVKPILMIAFTNHALDHLLTNVLDAGITNRIVRLGGRSADERILQYSIENLERVSEQSRLSRSFGSNYQELKSVQQEILNLMKKFNREDIRNSEIVDFLGNQYPEHYEHIVCLPPWIQALIALSGDEDDGWETVGKNKQMNDDHSGYGWWLQGKDLDFLQRRQNPHSVNDPHATTGTGSLYVPATQANRFESLSSDVVEGRPLTDDSGSSEEDDYDSSDLETDSEDEEFGADWQQIVYTDVEEASAEAPAREDTQVVTSLERNNSGGGKSNGDTDELSGFQALHISDLNDPRAFFAAYSMDKVPDVPTGNRSLDILLAEGQMWTLSLKERQKMHQYWNGRARHEMHENCMGEYQVLREKHENLSKRRDEERDEIRRDLLCNMKIIGCTTTGAAKFSSLLKGIEPKVMLVEEAGQVMEAHILANLVPSIEHLILIGDPLQLRPTLNNFKLSVDSRRGRLLYKFDMSLMERLSSSGFPMSRIDVQRRMRPSIAQLVRNALYPGLEDHQLVKEYPDVRGFARNVFFLTHEHRENDGNEEDPGSKYNTYEVNMIRDVVLYLLRQGCYSQEGDIVVLCAYLGQLARVRDALSHHVAIVIDERDQEALNDQQEGDVVEESKIEHIQISKRVRLRTVDNYQGEEAKIVILSLVRNAGGYEDETRQFGRTIGFLKSKNRMNVALSRAKHGLFMLGNATQLAAKSDMWRVVLEELERHGNIGKAFPVACQRHPDDINFVSEPGQLPGFAPDGGCLQPCNYRLKCGHVCPYKCHPDDLNHVTVVCSQPCRRLCDRRHPCSKHCSDDCGKCLHPTPNVELPCGHFSPSVPCHLMENLEAVKCIVIVEKQLPTCEHTAELPCSTDVTEYICTRPCNGVMTCCGRDCSAQCYRCQRKNVANELGRTERMSHCEHLCNKSLYCGHECSLPCSRDHQCMTKCQKPCRQKCVHARCSGKCSTPCAPCMERCTWLCSHFTCPLPCGSVCTRLPCDKRCQKLLRCGHRCPSVCGEDCIIQKCPACAPPELQKLVVDLVLYLKLEDIVVDEESLDNLLITLPECGHVFTVETLDGISGLEDYYSKDQSGTWSGLTSPQNSGERRKPPMCPTCRAAITSPRYSRVFKSANLDLLERNVISYMSNRMLEVKSSLNNVVKEKVEQILVAEVSKIKPRPVTNKVKELEARKKAKKTILRQTHLFPVPAEEILPGNRKLFNVSAEVVSVWNKAVKELITIYKKAADICKTRSAHTAAWEAAFSFLYEQEMDRVVAQPERAPRRPEEYAMRSARMNVGTLEPRGDKRFLVEAIWMTLQIRFLLVDLAQVWIKNVGDSKAYTPAERQAWGFYGMFLLATCKRDIQVACEIAQESDSHRQLTRSVLLSLRVQLEQFRFNVEMSRQNDIWSMEQRLKFAEEANQHAHATRQTIITTVREHGKTLPDDVRGWCRDQFLEPAQAIREEWEKLENSLRRDTFYEPLSLDEKMAVVTALAFSHTGHFYNCPNGHTFVITECGGAMESSRCPECGETIGGNNHMLHGSNSRATEYEDLSRHAGSQRSPWRWGN